MIGVYLYFLWEMRYINLPEVSGGSVIDHIWKSYNSVITLFSANIAQIFQRFYFKKIVAVRVIQRRMLILMTSCIYYFYYPRLLLFLFFVQMLLLITMNLPSRRIFFIVYISMIPLVLFPFCNAVVNVECCVYSIVCVYHVFYHPLLLVIN